MHPAFSYPRYTLQRKFFSIANQFRIFNPEGKLVMFTRQKMFKLREDIRIYEDESKSRELLLIDARQVIDFAAAYDVVDAVSGEHVGTLRRKGFSSMVRDRWQVLDAGGREIGRIAEDSLGLAMLRRILLGSLLPQTYTVSIHDRPAAEFRQKFNLIRYVLEIDFSHQSSEQIDPRLGLASAVLLAAIEGKQD
jgi:uncharacterized protein YxjI